MEILLILFLSGFLCSIVAGYKNKSPYIWFFVGALIPVVAMLFLLFMPANPVAKQHTPRFVRSCPKCKEKILAEAELCKHCKSTVEPVQPPIAAHTQQN